MGGKAYRCRFVPGWEALRQAVTDAPPAALLIVDPYEGTHRDGQLSPELRALLWEFPSATVLAALQIRPGRSHDLRTLGEWGVTDIISLEEDDTSESIARRLRAAQGRPLQNLLERSLPPSTSGKARMLLMTAAEVVSMGGRGKDLARALHLSERTVLRWAERAGLPPPRRLMAWMRILQAASLLDDPGRTVLSVAYACSYASDSSLRRAMQDFLGTIPTTLRREGAFVRASRTFLEELTDLRMWGKERRRGQRVGS
ncbi:MAG TPA: helix-turn-helix domain-containing protein [Longimicrobiaceae bacterium]|nr:helix-turn-helix domain-containing protein [Longimicrobiaceae bacterium]